MRACVCAFVRACVTCNVLMSHSSHAPSWHTPLAQLHGAIEIGDVVMSIDDSPLDGLTAVAVNRILVGISPEEIDVVPGLSGECNR